jgi:3-oxoadipate enol-lactonase
VKAFLNNGHIHYEESGTPGGLPVVFLHGFPFSHEMWAKQTEAVAPFCRVVTYDIRGHGMSDIGDGQYTIDGHADDLFALLDHLKITKGVLVGLSMGGYITLRAIQRDQDRFAGTVLADTRSEADPDEGKLKRFDAIKAVKRDGSEAFAEGFVRAVFAPGSFTSRPEAVAAIRRIIERTPPLSIAGTLLALASRTDTTPFLSSIRIPTLILVGEHDVTTPPSASRAMHERIPGSEFAIIPGAAHMSNLENPEVFNRHLVEFLHRLPRPLV